MTALRVMPFRQAGHFRRVDHAVTHHEHVLAGTFGHIAFRIQQQRFFGSAGQGFVAAPAWS
jgi:hypothetical protein